MPITEIEPLRISDITVPENESYKQFDVFRDISTETREELVKELPTVSLPVHLIYARNLYELGLIHKMPSASEAQPILDRGFRTLRASNDNVNELLNLYSLQKIYSDTANPISNSDLIRIEERFIHEKTAHPLWGLIFGVKMKRAGLEAIFSGKDLERVLALPKWWSADAKIIGFDVSQLDDSKDKSLNDLKKHENQEKWNYFAMAALDLKVISADSVTVRNGLLIFDEKFDEDEKFEQIPELRLF